MWAQHCGWLEQRQQQFNGQKIQKEIHFINFSKHAMVSIFLFSMQQNEKCSRLKN